MAEILIIDDDRIMADMLAEIVSDMGHLPSRAACISEGIQQASVKHFDVILLDVKLPDGNGLSTLPKLRSLCGASEVIIITAFGDRDGAELALDSGAWDYIQKTASISDIKLSILRAVQYAGVNQTKMPNLPDLDGDGIIGKSSKLGICFSRLSQAVTSDANVLITGETGTGKELFARAVHKHSSRAGGPFITVDCAALPPTLVESQLFGHEKGAFTGADKKMDGMIKQADGGILFLDEIGELPLPVQKAFLRVLQERRFRPLGARADLESNFRVVAATHQDLNAMVHAGTFRSDLLYRLRSLVIELPPLREHGEDIPELVLFYTAKFCERYGIDRKELSPEFLEVLAAYDWPGNVRELVNAVESAIAASFQEPKLYPKHLPTHIRLHFAYDKPDQVQEQMSADSYPTLKNIRETAVLEAERQYLQKLILDVQGDIREACKVSGLSRPQLYAQLRKHRISRVDNHPSD